MSQEQPPQVPKKTSTPSDPAMASTNQKRVSTTKVRQHEQVQASNTGSASVKKLAAWLANDPTTQKKTTVVRKGSNIIRKSRMFEKGKEDVIMQESHIAKGSVHRRAEQFQSGTEKRETAPPAPTVSVSDKKKWLEGAFSKGQTEEDDDPEEDSMASMSVQDKRQWLQNAFKSGKGDESSSSPTKRVECAPTTSTDTKNADTCAEQT